MSNGLKNIQSHARAYARRERLESGQPLGPYDDDSGVSGIGLTPIEDMADYSSPETGSAGARSTPGGSSNGGSSTHHASFSTNMHHAQPSYHQGTYHQSGYQPQHGYSNSVSSTGTAGYAQAQTSSSQGASPYMSNRLPGVGDLTNLGINSLISRGPGNGS